MASARPPAGLPEWSGRYAARWTAATLATYGRLCHLCRQPGATTADHLVPRSEGGADSLRNLRPAHHGCNVSRQAMPLHKWFAKHPAPRREALPPSRRW